MPCLLTDPNSLSTELKAGLLKLCVCLILLKFICYFNLENKVHTMSVVFRKTYWPRGPPHIRPTGCEVFRTAQPARFGKISLSVQDYAKFSIRITP